MTKSEIISIIAERTGVSRADVRLFLDKFNEIVFKGLNDDQLVKIKGLGTFKMVSVKARKSVSVNGGEAIEIPAHNKLTFTAEKVFADMVNEPLAHLEVVELSDSSSDEVDSVEEGADDYVAPSRMKKLSEEAEELKGLLADINGLSMSTASVEEQKEMVGSVVEEHKEEIEDVVEEQKAEEKVDDVIEEQKEEDIVDEQREEKIVEEVVEEQKVEEVVEEQKKEEVEENVYEEERQTADVTTTNSGMCDKDDTFGKEGEKKTGITYGGKIGRLFLLCMVLLLVLLGLIYWMNFREADDKGNMVKTVEVESVAPVCENTVEKEDSVVPEDKSVVEEKLPDGKLTIEQMRTMEIDYTVIQGTETVRDGSRLTMISLRAYGHKEFWIYLFLANRDQLRNPGQIRTGMVIKIPKIDSRLVDASNSDCLQYAKELQKDYVK
ncbi:MAG: HU family DNA-binding protein [Paludibacteraceae bacterium]|nr:HU family DNA-binding protein [Paludibacteraceae bacterium]